MIATVCPLGGPILKPEKVYTPKMDDVSVVIALSKSEIERMMELVGVSDMRVAVLVTARQGLRYLEKINSAVFHADLGSVATPVLETGNLRKAAEIAYESATAAAPFTKEALVRLFSHFNTQGVTPISTEEADDFWDYLVLRGFKNSGGTPLNLSNVGVCLKNWRVFEKARKVREYKESCQRKGEETDDEKFARIRRNLQDLPED